MAATYEPISTTTLSTSPTSITFSSIPSTYTDLKIVVVNTGTTLGTLEVTYNNDTGSNYSRTILRGDGSTASSSASTNQTKWQSGDTGGTAPSMVSIDVFSYAGSTYKTGLAQASNDQNGSGRVTSCVGLWRSTSAVNRVDLAMGGNAFASGTTVTIYGILKA